MDRGRNLELKNETSKSNSLFLCRKHEIKAHFSALHTLVEMGYSKEKIMLQKRKRISSEPGRPIFSGYLFCQRFPAASCRSQDAHLIVMGCAVFAPASEADVFCQRIPGCAWTHIAFQVRFLLPVCSYSKTGIFLSMRPN